MNDKIKRRVGTWASARSLVAIFALLLVSVFSIAEEIPLSVDDISEMDVDQLLNQLSDDSFFLDEIVVTATKREDNLNDVPISIVAFGSSVFEDAHLEDVRYLANVSPSLNFSVAQSVASTTTLQLRGVGTEGNQIGFESSVGFFIDGVYQSRPGFALTEFLDIDQVELLRGPQGTLFGRNTSVGAVSVKSKKPHFDGREATLRQGFGNYDLRVSQGIFNVPLSDTLSFRLATAMRERGGVISSATENADDFHDRDRSMIRGQLLWQPQDHDLELRLVVDEARSDERCCVPVQVTGVDEGVTNPLTAEDIGFSTAVNPDARISDVTDRFERSEQRGISLDLNWRSNHGFELTYLPSYREFDSTNWGDLTADGIAFLDIDANNPSEVLGTTESHELRFQGEQFDGQLDWLVGAFYIKEDVAEITRAVAGEDADVLVQFHVPSAADIAGAGAENHFSQHTESVSLFTHNIIELSEKLTLTLGARYVEESRVGGFIQSDKIGSNTGCLTNAGPGGIDTSTDPGRFALGLACAATITPAAESPFSNLFTTTFDDSSLTYLASLQMAFDESNKAYLSHSKGFKSGGLNLEFTASGLTSPTYASEEVDSWELGLKSQLFDGAVQNNIALFYMDIENYQLGVLPDFRFQIFNIDAASSYGLELENKWVVSERLRWSNSLAYVNAQFDDDCAGPLAGVPAVELQCGEDLPKAPAFTAISQLEFNTNFDSTGLTLSPVVRYESSYQPFAGRPSLKQSATTLVDLTVSWYDRAKTWQLDFWGLNLTDQTQVEQAFNSIAPSVLLDLNAFSGFVNEPRTYGATLSVNFKG